MTTEPTDAELKAMWQLHAADIGGIFHYARAVLAKWGQPAGATEEVENLRKALVYAAFALHGTPQYMLAQGIALIGGDTVRVSRDGWTVEASGNPYRQPTPAQAAEPVAWLRNTTDPQPHAVTNLNYRSAADTDAGIEYIPVFAAPQPVAREPLDEARRLFDAGWKAAALFCDREDVVADGIIGFGACPQFEAAFSAAHGLKGDQHGTE